jgi:psp operon transcriptional activator
MNLSEKHERLLGESANFLQIQEQVSELAPLTKPVLVIGERGTGKELIAERLHFLSQRWDQAYIKTNCATFNENLLESELFGHEMGAFTGASKLHIGRFERASGGSLFLDELAFTSSAVQEKLLRVIEYGEFERLGGRATLKTDVRIIAATNQDLPTLAEQGKFRHDLLDRLAFDVITLPPLRHRQEDILLLANHFAIGMCQELGREYFPGFSKTASDLMLSYNWPGNIRELKNVVERCVTRHKSLDDPLDTILFDPFDSPYRPALDKPSLNADQVTVQQEKKETTSEAVQLPVDMKQVVKDCERDLVIKALSQAQYNQRVAADLLNLSYHQFRGLMKKHKGQIQEE